MIPEYEIRVVRKASECVAGIAELGVFGKGKTSEEALLAVLRAEKTAKEALQASGIPLPPAACSLDPLPKLTRWISKHISFFAKLIIGYMFVICITVVAFLVILPSMRSKAENYILNGNAAVDVEKVMSRLGVSLCLKKQ